MVQVQVPVPVDLVLDPEIPVRTPSHAQSLLLFTLSYYTLGQMAWLLRVGLTIMV